MVEWYVWRVVAEIVVAAIVVVVTTLLAVEVVANVTIDGGLRVFEVLEDGVAAGMMHVVDVVSLSGVVKVVVETTMQGVLRPKSRIGSQVLASVVSNVIKRGLRRLEVSWDGARVAEVLSAACCLRHVVGGGVPAVHVSCFTIRVTRVFLGA